MIYYETGRWSISFIFRCTGSVFPRAVTWALPSAIIAMVVSNYADRTAEWNPVVSQAWYAFSSVLGFLIIFRTQQGYSRYWEGASLLQSVKAYWLNATSNLVAFCTDDPRRQEETDRFQHLLVRLVSLLHCSALQSVSMMHDDDFEIIELSGLSAEYVAHVNAHEHNKCFIVLQSVQQLVVEHIRLGILDIPAPIVSRVFQELSNGIVALTNVRKITDIPFPFPYAQLVTVMLIGASILTPVISGMAMSHPAGAATLTFISIFAFWSINYIAQEIEMPFGDDENDLPIGELQREMNDCLKNLLHPLIEKSPQFEFTPGIHAKLDPETCSLALHKAHFLKEKGHLHMPLRSSLTDATARIFGKVSGGKRKSVYKKAAKKERANSEDDSPRGEKTRKERADSEDSPSGEKTMGLGAFNHAVAEKRGASDNMQSMITPTKKDEDAVQPSSDAAGERRQYPLDKGYRSTSIRELLKDENDSNNSHKDICQLQVNSEFAGSAPLREVVVEIQEPQPVSKEPKFICMSSSSSSPAVVPKEAKAPDCPPELDYSRLSPKSSFLEDGGMCQRLSAQSRHMEALLERIATEVEQIRADGARLSYGLLGAVSKTAQTVQKRSPDATRASPRSRQTL